MSEEELDAGRWALRRPVRIWITAISLGSIGLGFLMGGWPNLVNAGNGSPPPFTNAALLILGGAVLAFGYCFMAQVVWPIRDILRKLRQATPAVPSPAEIAAQLEHDLGRRPTAQEVAAVHLMRFSQCSPAPDRPVERR